MGRQQHLTEEQHYMEGQAAMILNCAHPNELWLVESTHRTMLYQKHCRDLYTLTMNPQAVLPYHARKTRKEIGPNRHTSLFVPV